MLRFLKKNYQLLFGIVGVIFGLLGTVLGLLGYLDARDLTRRSKILEAKQLLDEAWDLMGGAQGTTSLTIPYPESVKDVQNLEEARRRLERALIVDPESSMGHHIKGVYLHATGKHGEAEREYRYSLSLKEDAEVYSSLGALLLEERRTGEAVKYLEKALALDHLVAAAHFNLGLAYREKGELQKAEDCFRQSAQIDPFADRIFTVLGSILEEQENFQGAELAYRRSVALDAEDANVLVSLGRVLLIDGRTDEAVVVLRKAVSVEPVSAGAYYNLGNALRRKGLRVEAKEAFRRGDEMVHVNFLFAVPTGSRRAG